MYVQVKSEGGSSEISSEECIRLPLGNLDDSNFLFTYIIKRMAEVY